VVCTIVLTAAMLGLGFRLAFLHLAPHEEALRGVRRTSSVSRKLLAGRGRILDRRGGDNILALNLPAHHVCADPSTICRNGSVRETAAALAALLDLPVDGIAVRLNRPERKCEFLSRYADAETVEAIRAADLAGIEFRPAVLRHYPHDSFLCHVLGFVNHGSVGSAGVEQYMDRYLAGSSGIVETRVNALRQELYARRDTHIPALEGADVHLTIDQNVQYMVEKALDAAMEEHSAKAAWAIVQHVKTGAILAMASRPGYDPNEFRFSTEKSRLNRTIGCVYEPGSTMKAVVFAAALNECTVTPETVIDCENGAWPHAGKILHDFHSYGELTVADGIKKSSNIMSAKIALGLGNRRFYGYLCAFGFGSRLGVDLPGEESGILHPVRSWSNISCSRLAIGQGVAVTALQMLGAFCAIANDGFLMRPYVVHRVVDRNGTVLLERAPEVLSRPIDGETAEIMRHLLRRVTEEGGTGRRACVEGYEVAGKTGTAQKAIGGVYSSEAHVASFVGFLPARNPEIGVIVVVDEPQPLHTGGVVAGPVFKRIAGETVRCLDIPPAPKGTLARR